MSNGNPRGHIIAGPSRNVQKWVTMLTHFLCLSILFILPEALMTKSFGDGPEAWRIYLRASVYVAVFYLNYYVIIDKCIGRRYWIVKLLGWNLAVALCAMCIMYLLISHPEMHRDHRHRPYDIPGMSLYLRKASFLMKDLVMVLLTVALSLAVKLSDYWMKLRHKNHKMEMAQRQEELDNLKHQLTPHFLFNTLNSIYALIAISPDKAQQAVHELSRLLRFVLYENAPTVPIADELAFVDNYVKLMKLRIGNKFPINVELDCSECPTLRIAPLLFISPVENAFKHGNTGRPDAFINISIKCADNTVECMISNRFDQSQESDNKASGIGQTNLRRRIDLIYGQNASIECKTEGDIYTFYLKIKLITT